MHVPGSAATRHMIDRKAFARMKRSAFLINTARGSVVDEDALVWALGERLIAGAALDVYQKEPAVHPGLTAFENVVLAPHLGSATRETRTRDGGPRGPATCSPSSTGSPPLTPDSLMPGRAPVPIVMRRLAKADRRPRQSRPSRRSRRTSRKILSRSLIATMLLGADEGCRSRRPRRRVCSRRARTPRSMAKLHARARSRS